MPTSLDYGSALSRMLALVDHERRPYIGPETERAHQPRYDLTRVDAFLRRLGNLQQGTPTVHVAGSKGKGSTAAMCASVLRCQGYRVGLYTSPHLHTFRERIAVDGAPIPEQAFAALLDRLWAPMEEIGDQDFGRVTVFELLTAMGLAHFRDESTDFNVLEVGLGGRLDATNVVSPTVCVITSLSLDHTHVLGDTLEEIAAEKAGIIKPGVPVVSSPQPPGAMEVIRDVCQRQGSTLLEVGKDVRWIACAPSLPTGLKVSPGQRLRVHGRTGDYHLQLPLLGDHQLENASTALAALELLQDQGHELSCRAIVEGFATVQWPCRLEVLAGEEGGPLVVADGAHNPYSAQRLQEVLPRYLRYQRVILILGVSRDKNLDGIVGALGPMASSVIVTSTRHPRAAPPEALAQALLSYGVEAQQVPHTAEALAQALDQAGEDDLILATGSLFLAAEVREIMKGIPPEIYPQLSGV